MENNKPMTRFAALAVLPATIVGAPLAAAETVAGQADPQPTLSLHTGVGRDGRSFGAQAGLALGRLELSAEMRRTTEPDFDYEDHRIGIQAGWDLLAGERMRLYALGRIFLVRQRTMEMPGAVVERDGLGTEAGLGVTATLTSYAELFGEYAIGKIHLEDSEIGAELRVGLRFRQ